MGAIHGRGYYDRIGLGEACFSGARGRCRGRDGSAQAASACAGSGVLWSTAALSSWPGGVRDGALLGTGVARAWARGATDASAIREGVTCRATATRLSRRPVLSPLARFVRHEPTRVVWWLVSAK